MRSEEIVECLSNLQLKNRYKEGLSVLKDTVRQPLYNLHIFVNHEFYVNSNKASPYLQPLANHNDVIEGKANQLLGRRQWTPCQRSKVPNFTSSILTSRQVVDK
ncbi:hypothetical protein Csa_016206 [Cucumis sativus]|uniref:Uncharacterized protein n=1 Tax=Cucumis sativus TaxID=3659 RepID=A0A0A0K690_CUCSA|nr:hypothetical protein Csa_016206 [Cucumis sativus]